MQAQTTGDRVQEVGVGDRDGDDVGDIELEEVYVVEDTIDVGVADRDEDEEGDGDEVEHGGHNSRVAPMDWRGGHAGQRW